MSVVKMYEASDGSLFKKFEDFAKHEESLKVRALCCGVEFNKAAFERDDRDNEVLFPEKIDAFLASNAETIRGILNASVVHKRGRKTVKADASA